MHIHQAGRDHLAVYVDNLCLVRSRQVGTDHLHPAVPDQHVGDTVQLLRRIDDPTAFEKHGPH